MIDSKINVVSLHSMVASAPTGNMDDDEVIILDDYTPGPRRDLKLWFSDGTVVLEVENLLFRVHRSILSTHSNVFRDMFTLPVPDGPEQEAKYGCPLIRMPDDSAQMTQLLMTIYYPFHFRNYSYCFDYISAILRLSTKYDIPYLRQNAIQKLKEGFPSLFQSFCDPAYQTARSQAQDHIIEAINLARETNCPEILPIAFYYCTQHLSMSTILNGDGLHQLSFEDVKICLSGRETLLRLQRTTTHAFFYRSPADMHLICPAGCGASNAEWAASMLRTRDMYVPLGFVNYTWRTCGLCSKAFHAQYPTSRWNKLWKNLPSIFGLESWDYIDAVQNI